MSYRKALPQLNGKTCLTDGGIETVMVFQRGIDLPGVASFTLLDRPDGDSLLDDYFRAYTEIAHRTGLGLLLESPTWRANPDWAAQLGFSPEQLDRFNTRAIAAMERIRQTHQIPNTPMPISGCVGPRGDGYVVGGLMSSIEAQRYHDRQIGLFADSPADLITALTLNYSDEAIGALLAARHHGIPAAISFTVEVDGKLPSGESLADAIERCDELTDGYAAYFMVNCAHPTHFAPTFEQGGDWLQRVRGLRANASKMSHADLDNSTELDQGDPAELAAEIYAIHEKCCNLTVVGGCCGTDHRHIENIAARMSSQTEATRC